MLLFAEEVCSKEVGRGELRVRALFCDYDGTLAPLGVPRTRSRLPKPVANVLYKIRQKVPIAIVTAKDYHFIRPRTPFADAWSCVYGIETILKDGQIMARHSSKDLSEVVSLLRDVSTKPSLEYKVTSSGELCGLGVEWVERDRPEQKDIKAIIHKIRKHGFQVLQVSSGSAFDIISNASDKGQAVKTLRSMLGVRGGLMYMGDTQADNPALLAADIGVGVVEDGSASDLECEYFVKKNHVPMFLSALLENNMLFSDRLPWVIGSKKPRC